MSSEPALAPLTGEVFPSSVNSADDARVDIAARGFSTHQRQTLSSSFKANEWQKKRQYNQRIVEVEHGSNTVV